MSTLPFEKPQEYIAVWPGDDHVMLKTFGDEFLCPNRHTVAVAGQGRYKFGSAKDRNGNPIPGTLLLRSRRERDDVTGGYENRFDARAACEHLYTNRPLLERGFSVVMDVDDVEAARTAGRVKWEEAQIKAWEETLRLDLEEKAYYEKKGQPQPTTSNSKAVREAMEGLARVNRTRGGNVSREDVMAVLGGGTGQAPKPEATPALPPSAFRPEPSEADIALAASDLFSQLSEAGINLTKAQMAGLLAKDPEVMSELQSRLDTAKIGA